MDIPRHACGMAASAEQREGIASPHLDSQSRRGGAVIGRGGCFVPVARSMEDTTAATRQLAPDRDEGSASASVARPDIVSAGERKSAAPVSMK